MSSPVFLALVPGVRVVFKGRTYKISHLIDAEQLLAQDIDTGRAQVIRMDQVRSVATEPGHVESQATDLSDFTDKEWKIARKRYKAIEPLLNAVGRTSEEVRAVAAKEGVHQATIYAWLKSFQTSGHLSALVPAARGPKLGVRRLTPQQEAIIEKAIQEVYLTKQRPSPLEVVERVQELCAKATPKISPPHANTVRNRVKEIPSATVLRRRGRKDLARNRHEPIKGPYPDAHFPLAVVQIDHTPADSQVVDETTRQAIGRPTVTLAIDAYSRMVVGIYVSLEKPSALSVGLCLAQAMLPKAEYLSKLEIPGSWPVFGKMRTVFSDNAKEFRGKMLSRASEAYSFGLQYRPPGRPHFGGHIERLMRTTTSEMHKWPGTTFSNIRQRTGYDSEKEAALTLREFEQNVVDFIVNIYHLRKHSDIGMPPIRKWEAGLLGDETQGGIGMPEVPVDPERIYRDFLPFEERSVQPYGIVMDDIYYYHEVLNRWIGSKDPKYPKRARRFVVRRDPRDISKVYFLDPEVREYYPIPYRNMTHPAVTLWEVQAARKRLLQDGCMDIDENRIFESVIRIRTRNETAADKTKSARRDVERTKKARDALAKKAIQRPETIQGSAAPTSPSKPSPAPVQDDLEDIFSVPVRPFDDIKVSS